jgi:hypothetical protein
MNLAILSIKVILYYSIGYTADYDPNDPLRFTEAFLSLLGAGITAYIIWLNSFRKEYKKMRTMLRKRTFKDTMRSFGKGFTLIAKLYILFISYCIWMGGETLFFIGTTYYPAHFRILLLGGSGFFLILLFSLIAIVGLTQPDLHESTDSQNSEDLIKIKSEGNDE